MRLGMITSATDYVQPAIRRGRLSRVDEEDQCVGTRRSHQEVPATEWILF